MKKKSFMDETRKSLFSPSLSYQFMCFYDLILYFVLYFYTLKQGRFGMHENLLTKSSALRFVKKWKQTSK